MKHYLAIGLTTLSAVTFFSCDKDDPAPKYTVETPTIHDEDYTMGGDLELLYSTDGTTFSETVPTNLAKNTVLHVKVSNGTEDLTSDNFIFDWSASTITPADGDADVAEFTIADEDVIVDVVVKDKLTLLTSDRAKGRFLTVEADGDTTFAFKISYDGGTLKDTRGFVYHYNQDKFFVSQASNSGGYLYAVNVDSKEATLINNNDGNDGAYQVWDAIVNWGVAEDDSLIAIGDFNGDGNGIVKFGVDGGRSLKTAQADICCGLGMLFDAKSGEFLIGNGENNDNNELIFDRYASDGTALSGSILRTFEGFPNDGVNFEDEWITVKAMAETHEGIFAIVYPSGAQKSYFVKIDFEAGKLTYIETLGVNGANQFNTLATVPAYRMK